MHCRTDAGGRWRRVGRAALVALSVPILAALSSVEAGAAETRIPTVTRLVQQFMGYEQRLEAALKAHDAAAAEALLDANFEMQVAAAAADVVPREAWLATSLRQAGDSGYSIANLGVRDFDTVAMVTYDWRPAAQGRKARAGYFVTDIWRRSGEQWRLALRIIAESPGKEAIFPGRVGMTPPVIEKKY